METRPITSAGGPTTPDATVRQIPVSLVDRRSDELFGRDLSLAERAPFWRVRLELRESFSRSLTLIPCLYLIGAVLLGILVPSLDHERLSAVGRGIGNDSAQSILEAVAAGMVAFSGLVVSVAVLVVQFGAGQYSPRLVQVFRRDPVIKNALGMFVAPGVYGLVAAAVVANQESGKAHDVTVIVALVLMVAALVALFRFIGRLLDLMRPRQLYARLIRWALPRGQRPDTHPMPDLVTELARIPVTRLIRHRHRYGVLDALDVAYLVKLARKADAVIELVAPVGAHLGNDAPLLVIRGGHGIDERAVRRGLLFGDGRTLTQDPTFAIRCIVDVTVRALSAAINDPTSAVEGVDALAVVLQQLGRSEAHASAILDEAGAVRLLVPGPNWDELVDLALSEIRDYGDSTLQVTRRLAAMFDELESTLPPERIGAITRHRNLLCEHLERAYPNPGEREFAGTPDRLGLGGRNHFPNPADGD